MRHSTKKPQILLIHARGTWTGVPRLPKLCSNAGAEVTIFAPPDTTLWKARYITNRIAAPAEEGAFSIALRQYLSTEVSKYDWVLVGDENAVAELVSQEDTSWLRGWFPVDPTPDALDRIISKAAFTLAARTNEVATPLSHICSTLAEVEAAVSSIGYPVMLKAALSFAGNGVVKASNPAELRRAFAKLGERVPLVVQRFEVGRVGSSQILFDHGRLVSWASSYKVACFPEPFGPSSVRELMLHPDMERTLTRIGKMTGFHGLCGVDWLHRQSDGALLVLEFNPRPAPVVHLGPMGGADFSAAIADMLAKRPDIRPPANLGPRVIYLFPQHLVRCIEGRYWRDLLNWLPGRGYHDIPWDQPRLLGIHSAMLYRRFKKASLIKLSSMFGCSKSKSIMPQQTPAVAAAATASPAIGSGRSPSIPYALSPGD